RPFNVQIYRMTELQREWADDSISQYLFDIMRLRDEVGPELGDNRWPGYEHWCTVESHYGVLDLELPGWYTANEYA
ncbi:MAG: hypothetical protein R3301_20000, partial [Saprospiraceae bacterium]|nr:hypothetical protein [Saprospiraceae bacterium]